MLFVNRSLCSNLFRPFTASKLRYLPSIKFSLHRLLLKNNRLNTNSRIRFWGKFASALFFEFWAALPGKAEQAEKYVQSDCSGWEVARTIETRDQTWSSKKYFFQIINDHNYIITATTRNPTRSICTWIIKKETKLREILARYTRRS